MDEELIFRDEDSLEVQEQQEKWKILIVDDEIEVHKITQLALRTFAFDEKPLTFLNAYSAKEAIEVFKNEDDIALILLDVVMESDDAGLQVVKNIRQVLKNPYVRIVLRTGQPGQAPEEHVIRDYDINDYKEKTELTARKLYSLLYSTLRSYRDIMALKESRDGLRTIIDSLSEIYELKSLKRFASAVLVQLTAILNINKSALYCSSTFASKSPHSDLTILAATSEYKHLLETKSIHEAPAALKNILELALQKEENIHQDNQHVWYMQSKHNNANLLVLEGRHNLSDVDRELIDIFVMNVAVAYQNLECIEIDKSKCILD
jgi:CheY-like chemotaxis protein